MMNNQSNDLAKKIQELEAQVNELVEANKSLSEAIAKPVIILWVGIVLIMTLICIKEFFNG